MTSRPDIIAAAPSPTGLSGLQTTDPNHNAQYPEWLRERLAWFEDLKFGLFLHWGPYCQMGCIESWPLVEDDPWARPGDLAAWVECGKDIKRFHERYWALNRTFNPVLFDPTVWADAAAYAGMKYLAFTTKHHDGFCMFNTQTTDYCVTHPDCPFSVDPRANLARRVFDAFRARDFGISCYFSKSDWHSPNYWWPGAPATHRNPNYDTHAEPERWEGFVQFVHAQIRELMTDYGRMDALWLDGGQVRPPDQDIRMDEIAAFARELQPGLIMADRTVGGPNENILTPEQEVPDEPLPHTWESCLTMGTSWSYKPDDHYKSSRELIHLLTDVVSRNGNLLLNIGPRPDGTLPSAALGRLREIGDWMAVNSEAIHGSRAIAPYGEGNVRFTTRAGFVYAIVQSPADDAPPPSEVTLKGLQPGDGGEVKLLGRDEPLQWRREGEVTKVSLPGWPLPCKGAWVLRFEG